MATEDQLTPWIGFVHMRTRVAISCLGKGVKGAYAHILALATDEIDYYERVRSEIDALGLEFIEISDVDTVESYRQDGRIWGELEELSLILSPKFPVQYRTFDTYYNDDA